MKSLYAWTFRHTVGEWVMDKMKNGKEIPGMWDMLAEYFTAE